MKNLIGCLLITIIVIAGILSQGCEKEDGMSERFQLLTAHAWKYDTIFTICQDPEIVLFINMLDSGAKGSTVIYSANGSVVSPFESGKWKFSNGETEIITFDEDDPSDIYGHVRINVLTDDVLEITNLVDPPSSDTCYVKSRLLK